VNNPTMELIQVTEIASLGAASVQVPRAYRIISRATTSDFADERRDRASHLRSSGKSTSRRGTVTLDVVMESIASPTEQTFPR
jgi:hypothetical protein